MGAIKDSADRAQAHLTALRTELAGVDGDVTSLTTKIEERKALIEAGDPAALAAVQALEADAADLSARTAALNARTTEDPAPEPEPTP